VCGDPHPAARLSGAADAYHYGQPELPVDASLHPTFFGPARGRHGANAWDADAADGSALKRSPMTSRHRLRCFGGDAGELE